MFLGSQSFLILNNVEIFQGRGEPNLELAERGRPRLRSYPRSQRGSVPGMARAGTRPVYDALLHRQPCIQGHAVSRKAFCPSIHQLSLFGEPSK